jgi:hypothetical protein
MVNHTIPHPPINKIAAEFYYIKIILLRKGIMAARTVIEADNRWPGNIRGLEKNSEFLPD